MYAKAPGRLAAAGVSGGATYDGLIALTALEHDLELLTRDGRAERTYRALDVPHRLL
jgi:predicted nucleic acid-binding protein